MGNGYSSHNFVPIVGEMFKVAYLKEMIVIVGNGLVGLGQMHWNTPKMVLLLWGKAFPKDECVGNGCVALTNGLSLMQMCWKISCRVALGNSLCHESHVPCGNGCFALGNDPPRSNMLNYLK